MRKFTFKSLLIAAALCLGTSAWAQTTYYSQDYEAPDATADWTTKTSGRYNPVLLTENENTYLSVDQATRNNNGTTLTSTSLVGKVAAGTDFTMIFDMKISSSTNQSPTSFVVNDAENSSAILSIVATGTWTTSWKVNDNITVTLDGTNKGNGSQTIADVPWYTFKLTRKGEHTYLTITATSSETVVLERTLITTLSSTGGLGNMIFNSSRYLANFAIDNVVVRSIEDGDLPTLQETTYTINYKLGDDVVKTVTEASLETVTITADKVITENGVKYLIVSEEAPSITLDVDATKNVLNVPVRKSYTATLSVTTTIGDETLEPVVTSLTETDDKVCTWSYAYPLYVKSNDVYYIADNTEAFGEVGSFEDGDIINRSISYTNVAEDIVFFAESQSETTGANPAYSGGAKGYVGAQNKRDRGISVGTLPIGEYEFTVNIAAANRRSVVARVGTADPIASVGTSDADKTIGLKSATFTLTEETSNIFINGANSGTEKTNQSEDFDYVIIRRIGDATVSTTITAAGYSTFSAAYAVDFSKAEGLAAYTAKVNDGNQTITLTKIADGIVPANTGVVLKGAAGEYTGTITTTDATVDNDLISNNVEITSDGTIYVLNKVGENVGFYPLAEGKTLAAGKAYLQLPSGAKGYSFVWNDGETTGIEENYEFGTMSSDAATFDLSGRKVVNPTKGLYIKNGKKFIVK